EPVQDERAANMTYKERQRENKKAKEAAKVGSVGTAASYDMATALQTSERERRNSLAGHRDMVKKSGVDERVLLAFSRGYREKGFINKCPATEQDRLNKEADEKFYEDYTSNDLQRRQPHLERMVDELINIKYTRDMFTERYLRRNARQMGELQNKMFYMDNVMKDPINASFFEKLDPYRKAALEESFNMFVRFRGAMNAVMAKNGVDLDNAGYYEKSWDPGAVSKVNSYARIRKGAFDDSIGEYNQKMSELKAEQAERVYSSATSYASRMKAGRETLDRMKSRLQEDPDVRLTDRDTTSQYYTRAHVLLETGEGADEQNFSTMKTLTEVSRLQDRRPSEALYARVYDLVAPRVERIMACDVDELAGLTDEALMLKNEEINELFLSNMLISDMMKIKHPTATEGGENGAIPTLKDELVGYRNEEFSYKGMMLRGLHERARALAIRRSLENGYSPDEMFVREDRTLEKGKEMEWVQKRMNTGDTTMANARERWAKVISSGLMALRQRYIKTLGNEGRIEASSKLALERDPMLRELYELMEDASTDIEAAKIKYRLRDKDYYSLAYSKEELKSKRAPRDMREPEKQESPVKQKSGKKEREGLPENIGEPLFRSFHGFVEQEAAQKLLTPEKAREMVLNLAAGAGMQKEGAWKEPVLDEKGEVTWVEVEKDDKKREEALAKNKQGLAAHKEIYRAQFDMLTRKYGNHFEEISAEDFALHQADMKRDFRELQVAVNMTDKYPDYFDMSNPEDELLANRIDYYAFVGKATLDAVAAVFDVTRSYESDQQMRDELKNTILICTKIDPDANAAGEWLSANDEAFKHRVDWSQKVRTPKKNAE
ncbi:MAG: hypothetical protein LUH58_09670, partial [Lachnospiraceae bacterium]|nr:hypothetical protein [Lachnospiraceae bacterium]